VPSYRQTPKYRLWNVTTSIPARVTRSDLELENLARAFHIGDAPLKISDFIRMN
jgi:hypothetical protein